MENKKEELAVGRGIISRRKVVASVILLLAVCAAVAGLSSSENARGFLARGGAIAMSSFKDAFVGSAPGAIISDVDLAASSGPAVAEERLGQASSVARNAVPGSYKKSGANSVSVADDPAPQAVLPEPAAATKNTFVDASRGDNGAIGVRNASSSASDAIATATCSFPVSAPSAILRRVILSEIAWMGQPSSSAETAEHAANEEWMELKNISGAAVSLNGWRIMDSAGKIKISFGAGDALAPDGFYLLSRGGNSVSGISADKTYSGILPNGGDELAVLDAACGVSDFLDAAARWPGGSNVTKQTLERNADLAWQTSALAGGTPRAENSAGAWVAPAVSSSTEKYGINVMMSGNGSGQVMMKPGNMVCKTSCTDEYAKGTMVTLTASPASGADFVGWSGACSGASGCSLSVDGPVVVMAGFHLADDGSLPATDDVAGSETTPSLAVPQDASSSDDEDIANSSSTVGDGENGSATPTSSPSLVTAQTSAPPTVDHLVIAAVQIAGAASGDDFVKIYNPTVNTVDVSGWKLRKRSSTGTDSSLREFPKGSTVAPAGYFTWASSANGFAESIRADASSTETLAANNSVAIFDGTGTQVDAVAWGTGVGQYVEGAAYPASPVSNQVLLRKFAAGTAVDTDNNEDDFTL